jgi:hypothetical protein
MIFWGLADHRVEEVIDSYATREQAEETLRQVLEDEPRLGRPARGRGGRARIGVRKLIAGRSHTQSVVHSAHGGLPTVRSREPWRRAFL